LGVNTVATKSANADAEADSLLEFAMKF
jgi:hypothetical protein